MKQNKNKVAIVIAIMVLFSSLSIQSLAYTDNSSNGIDFEGQPIPYTSETPSNTWLASNGYNYSVDANNSYYNAYCAIKTVDTPTYVFAIPDSDFWRYYAVSVETGARIYWTIYSTSSTSNATINTYDSNTGYYYKQFASINNNLGRNPQVPTFDTVTNGISAVKDWIDNPPIVGPEPQPLNYTIPAGYALAVDISGLSPTGKITTVSDKAYSSPHVSNQTIAYVNDIPANGTAPLGNGISWSGIGNKDLFGRYKSWQHNLIPNPSYNYLVIYNPVHVDNYVDPEHEDYNSAIVVNLTEARSGRLISLNTELTASGQVGTVSTDNGGNVQYDEDSQSWVTQNQDGSPYNPSPYGDYLPNTENSVNDWLKNISNQISGFFTGAISAVTNLVSAGSAFFQVLTGLYGWLPISVLSVLTSALIIVITIGVIKVFL